MAEEQNAQVLKLEKIMSNLKEQQIALDKKKIEFAKDLKMLETFKQAGISSVKDLDNLLSAVPEGEGTSTSGNSALMRRIEALEKEIVSGKKAKAITSQAMDVGKVLKENSKEYPILSAIKDENQLNGILTQVAEQKAKMDESGDITTFEDVLMSFETNLGNLISAMEVKEKEEGEEKKEEANPELVNQFAGDTTPAVPNKTAPKTPSQPIMNGGVPNIFTQEEGILDKTIKENFNPTPST